MSAEVTTFNAHDSILGYVQQLKVALVLLLRAPDGSAVSIETLDDIVVESTDGQTLVQVKHRLERQADLTDYSTDLWKALRVWAEQLAAGALDLERTNLVLFTTDNAAVDSIAGRLRQEARSEAQAITSLNDVAIASDSKATKPGRDAWRALTDEQRTALVERVLVVDASPRITEIETEIREKLRWATEPEHLEPLVDRLVGWWLRRTARHLEQRSVDVIGTDELNMAMRDLREQFKLDNLPIDFGNSEAGDSVDDQQTFLHQLRIIGVNNERLEFAIRDFFRASLQRDRWLREDLLPPAELVDYEKRLVEEWRRHVARRRDEWPAQADPEEYQRLGREVLNWAEEVVRLDIRERCDEPYVRRGCYHILADGLQVGWHPNFGEELRQLLEIEETA
jgi:hypothetical protein